MALTKDGFAHHLDLVTQVVTQNTRRLCWNKLPSQSLYFILLNESMDKNPLSSEERLFPDHEIPQIDRDVPYPTQAVVDRLWREGFVPEWIDVTPYEVDDTYFYFQLRCCGRFTMDEDHLYHRKEGYPPFHCFGPALPGSNYDLQKDGQFDLHHFRDKRKKIGNS